MLDHRRPVGEAEGGAQPDLVLVLVRPVPAPLLRLPEHRVREGPLPGQLPDIVGDAVVIEELRGLELPRPSLHPQPEGDPGVDHRLPPQNAGEVLRGDVDVRKDLQVRKPPGPGAGPPAGQGRFFQLLALFAGDLALFEVELVLKAVPPDGHVHILGRVLGGAGAQAVEAQGVLVVLPLVVAVLAAGVELAEHQLPVPPLLLLVPVHRAAPALVLHLHAVVQEAGDGDEAAVALPGLVDGVGEDLKNGVLAALQPVGAKDDPGPLPDTVRPLQGADGLVAVVLCFFRCHRFLRLRLLFSSLTNLWGNSKGISPQAVKRRSCGAG